MHDAPFRRWLSALAFVLVAATSASTSGAPWPMLGHDAAHTGRTPVIGPQRRSIEWRRFANGTGSWNSDFWFPAVAADGTVYFGHANGVTALDDHNTVRWHHFTWAPARVAALAADGTLYAAASNRLLALSRDGRRQWTYAPSYGVAVLGNDGTIYTTGDGALHAVRPDGTLKWRTTVPGAYLPPAIGPTGAVYLTGGTLECNPFTCFPNSRLYELDASTGSARAIFSFDGAMGAPVVENDGTIYVVAGFPDYFLLALLPTGGLKWMHPLGAGASAPPALGPDGSIYVTAFDGNVYAVGRDGTRQWEFATVGASVGLGMSTSPIVGGDGTIYFGSQDHFVYALDADGTLKWWSWTRGISTSPSIGPDGTLYFGVLRGDADVLFAFAP